MQIDKQMVLDLLRERGDQGKAAEAERKLPDQVDHEGHKDLLQELGVNPDELLSKFGR
jgi:hypothetical protein